MTVLVTNCALTNSASQHVDLIQLAQTSNFVKTVFVSKKFVAAAILTVTQLQDALKTDWDRLNVKMLAMGWCCVVVTQNVIPKTTKLCAHAKKATKETHSMKRSDVNPLSVSQIMIVPTISSVMGTRARLLVWYQILAVKTLFALLKSTDKYAIVNLALLEML